MQRIDLVTWVQERKVQADSACYTWFRKLEEELKPEFQEAFLLPRAWWAMLSAAYLAGFGIQEAAALFCKMLGTVFLCPQMRLTCFVEEAKLVADPDHVPTVQEATRHPDQMVNTMEEFLLTNWGWRLTNGKPDLPIA